MRCGVDQRLSCLFEHAQVRDGGGERNAELLRLRRAGIVEDAAVAFEQDAGQAEREEMRQRLRHRGLERLDRHAQPAAAGQDRRRVDAERYAEPGRIDAALSHQRHQPVDAGAARRMHVEPDVDAVERDVVQRDRQRFRLCRQPIAECVRRALENQRQAGRALVDVVERLPVGAVRVGIVDALRDDPRRQRIGPHGARQGAGRTRRQRLDADAVIRARHQRFLERAVAERLFGERTPLLEPELGKPHILKKVAGLHCRSLCRRCRRNAFTRTLRIRSPCDNPMPEPERGFKAKR